MYCVGNINGEKHMQDKPHGRLYIGPSATGGDVAMPLHCDPSLVRASTEQVPLPPRTDIVS